jgi:hypothetical protein
VALQVNVSQEAWAVVTEMVAVMMAVFRLWLFCFAQRSGISDRLARLGKSSAMLTFGNTATRRWT